MSNPFIDHRLTGRRLTLPPLEGAHVLVHVVVNVEVWPFDAPMPRKLLGGPHGRDHVPDVPNFSWVEYGMRCGLPRLARSLREREVVASASTNAEVARVYPHAAELLVETGWEWIAHGTDQRALPSYDDERAVVAAALDLIEATTGRRPRGWLGPGLHETLSTPDTLSSLGVDYVCDWGLDDQPVWLRAEPRPLVAVPYNLELNDSLLFAAQWNSSSEYEHRILETLEVYDREREDGPKVLTLGLHPHLIGVPHRIRTFERVLDHLRAHPAVRFVTGSDLCDWYTEAFKDALAPPR